MARFHVSGNQVSCPSCGSTDFFQHDDITLTCNRDGTTVHTVDKAEVIIEQVVIIAAFDYNSSQKE